MSRSIQQAAVLDWYANERGNAFVTAVAGAGKTTVLLDVVELAVQNPRNSVAYAAFNKAIADEVKGKLEKRGLLSPKMRVGTFHSFGWSAWKRAYPECKLEDDTPRGEKKWDIIQARCVEKLSDGYNMTGPQALAEVEKLFPAVEKLVSYAKSDALFPEDASDLTKWHGYVAHYGLDEEIEDPNKIGRVIGMARFALNLSIKFAPQVCDFDDMIYMPVITGVKIWENDLILVDESQDLNPARIALTRRMVKPRWGRAIFVGDPRQAIYGFSGADADCVARITREFNCANLPLTVTFRCPKSVVAEARKLVPYIEAAPSAPEGMVRHGTYDEFLHEDILNDLGRTDAVLCRKNAPLLELAYTLIRRGIPCHMEGRDIGQGLRSILKKWKIAEVPAFLDKLEEWSEKQIAKALAKGDEMKAESIKDRSMSLNVLCEGCQLVSEVETKIDNLFRDGDTSTLTLASAHRSKGREWDRVFILGANRWMPHPAAKKDWQVLQEDNLLYVAITRSQGELTYISVPWED